jgi:hypothetical protein
MLGVWKLKRSRHDLEYRRLSAGVGRSGRTLER